MKREYDRPQPDTKENEGDDTESCNREYDTGDEPDGDLRGSGDSFTSLVAQSKRSQSPAGPKVPLPTPQSVSVLKTIRDCTAPQNYECRQVRTCPL